MKRFARITPHVFVSPAVLPLLSPLNFFSSRRSWSSNSRSYCICSIWASIRSLAVSQPSPDKRLVLRDGEGGVKNATETLSELVPY